LANEEQLAIIRSGVDKWNAWRATHIETRPNLNGADLSGANLIGADLILANLILADLSGARLNGARLSGADLGGARLSGADLSGARLRMTNLRGADLRGADLRETSLVKTSFVNATLDGCNVYGVSAWNVQLDGAKQTNLRITPHSEPEITVDNLEVAQFLYLMLHNQKIRQAINTLTSKVVLILGRFSEERKLVLDALRDALRQRDYVPVLFDFAGPENRNITETVTLLARMARFILADLTDPGSIPYELAKIVPDVHVPIQPLLLAGTTTFAMAGDLWMAREMLPIFRYTTPRELLAALPERVIAPAEAKVREIEYVRATAIARSGLP
jgi:Pentapeptide repeats (8 copies)